MENLAVLWSSLTARRRVAVIGATLLVFVAVLMLGRNAASRDMALLYSGLESGAAGDVVASLEQAGATYEVRGSAIFVDSARRDQLRMTLASEGLPANSTQGYELLDNLSGFGTTSQMFDAAYWRAKEGELARTIVASAHIRTARVHISTPSSRPFARGFSPTAAVTVTTVSVGLTAANANALRYLVASAVSGLSPDDVAVIDGNGGLVTGADDPASMASGDDRSRMLRERVERLLAAHVGMGNAVVEVSVETQTESESILERTFDPDSRVAISTDVEERTAATQDTRGGDVTVASNLPEGDGAGAGGASTNEDVENRTVTNYEVSEVQREIVRGPGAIRRVTVAVLVNDIARVDDAGETITESRPEEELLALRDLVASAVGFDEARGDEITIRSLTFEPVAVLGTDAPLAASSSPLNIMSLIQLGVLAGVALVLGLFVVRPILTSGRQSLVTLPKPIELPLTAIGGAAQAATASPALIESAVNSANATLAPPNTADENTRDATDADPVTRLQKMIESRQAETLQILQSWVDEPDKAGA
ncbi:MAG: flagellar M-ring protein FliF [Paracoccaceae bacterium]